MPEGLKPEDWLPLIQAALEEDIGGGDATTLALLDKDATASASMIARVPLTVAGLEIAAAVFLELDASARIEMKAVDGTQMEAEATLLTIRSSARALLTAERTALNFMQRLSGIATLTARYVAAVEGTSTRILDTRKTTPGWRRLEKYAVTCGGGVNHRFGLFDQIMIKDNHLVSMGGDIAEAVCRARAALPRLKIEVEADTIDQAGCATEAGADIILLDNMSIEELRRAVEVIGDRSRTEASGGIALDKVRLIAETGVDYISVGALTHSAPAVDISLEFHVP